MKRRFDLLYAIGALLFSPVLAIGLLRTGKWRTDWSGRFGKTPTLSDDPRPTLLLHGVSVGEINATRELVSHLSGPEGPPLRLVISATTNTGFDRAQELYGPEHTVVRFPFDFSWMVGPFLDRLRPQAVALMELEVWPNLAQECEKRGIPLAVINGRLSDSSFGTYRWARWLVRPMFEGLAAVAAQTEEYAQRFRDLGVPAGRVRVTDTMKWDTVKLESLVEGAAELGTALGIDPARPLVVAGSTGPGEEEGLLRSRPKGVQLLIVPRKPERFDEVAKLAPGIVRRSHRPDGVLGSEGTRAGVERGERATPNGDLFLLDTMGELTKAYSLADVAIVGRSFVPLGGSDPIEAVALGKPTIIGPRHENFREVVGALQSAGGIRVTEDPMKAAEELLADVEGARAMAEAGRHVVRKRQGATARHAELLVGILGVGKGGAHPEGEAGSLEIGSSKAGASDAGASEAGPGRKSRRRAIRRSLFKGFLLYMALGYLTTAFTRVEARDSITPTVPLPSADGTLLSGVFSVHTGRSHDARGTRDQVAAAAAAAGLDFVVVGDHPLDDRRPDWAIWQPSFVDGVLIDGGVELRAPPDGKILVMGVDSMFSRWEGDLESFLDFLDERGSASVVVHSRGPRSGERWEHGTVRGLEGWEVLDVSEASRGRLRGPWSLYHIVTLLVGTPLGLGDEALLHTMREGFETGTVAAYDSVRQGAPLTATAGLNVHPKLEVGPFLIPSYGPFFRTLVCHLAVEGPLPADPGAARESLAGGLRAGKAFISLGNHQNAKSFRLRATKGGRDSTPMGVDLVVPSDVPERGTDLTAPSDALVGDADSNALSGVLLRGGFSADPGKKVVYRILRDGVEQEWIFGPELEWAPSGPGLFRVEVYTYGARLGIPLFACGRGFSPIQSI